MDAAIRKFADLLDWSDYSRVDFALVVGVHADGLFPLGGHLTLSRDELEPTSPLHSRGKHFAVICGSDSLDSLRSALASEDPMRLVLAGHELTFGDAMGHTHSWSAILATDFGERLVGWPARTIKLTHLSRWNYFQKIELDVHDERFAELQPVPFASLSAALRFVGAETDLNLPTGLTIFAPIFARLNDPQLDLASSRVSVDVEAAMQPTTSDMCVAFSSRIQGDLPIIARAITWEQTDTHRWQVAATLPAGTSWTDVSLSVRGRSISRRTAYAPSLAVQAHTALSGGHVWLTNLLSPDKGKNRELKFERGVVALLSLGGLPTVPYGHDGLDRYMDFVSFAARNRVIVGECTVDTPSPDKMAKLRGRTEELGRQLRCGTEEVLLQSVVMVPMDTKAMPDELISKARDLRVALLWGERLEQLLMHITAGDSPEQVFDRIRYFST